MRSEPVSNQQAPVSLTQKFVSGELQFGFWGIIARGVGWGNSFFIISALTVYQYGVFQLFFSVYAILAEFMSWGGLAAGTEILRFTGRGEESKAKRLFFEYNTLRFVSAVALWALFFFGAPEIAMRYQPDLASSIRIMSFMFLGEFFLSVIATLVNMRLDFKALASRRSIGKSFQLVVLLGFFVFSTIGLREVFLSLVIGHFLATSILVPAAVRAWKPWREVHAERGPNILWKIARAHGKWDSIKNILSQFSSRAQPWLINFFVSTEAVGIYGVATSLAEVAMQAVPRNTMSTLITRIFYDKKRSQRVFTYAVKYLTMWGIAGIVGSVLAVPVIIHIFLPQYTPSLPFFFVLLLALPLKTFQWMTDLFLRVLRQQKFAFIRSITRSACLFALLLVFLPLLGIWALPLTEILVRTSVTYAGYRHLLKMRPEFRITPRLFFSFGADDQRILKNIWTHVSSMVRR